ncbi:MAG: D-cysteine desulfhydrase family protein [Alphaproteobacteria bacterium]|nr:MAG: D-cysteine desulfhydrase family protein [Alphaproteobacteria bacterium]
MKAQCPPLGLLDARPRARFLSTATPLEPLPNLGRCHERDDVFVKRDDLTGLALGGNKVRQLEFYLGEAVAQGADTLLITGAVQSNFVRMAVAAARKCAMDCHVQLEERVPSNDSLYRQSGNVLIERMLGANFHFYPEGEDEAGADARLHQIADELKEAGRKPYIIHLSPGHAPLGALGYVDAARELLGQLADEEVEADEIVVASGSGHTHAGLLFGLRALGSPMTVTGVCVRRPAPLQKPRLMERCQEIAELLEITNPVSGDDIRLIDDHLAPGYGRASEQVLEAMREVARRDALLTDPVYTGKSVTGLLDRLKETPPGSGVIFLHTGGLPALFAYEHVLAETFPPVDFQAG